MDAWARMFQEEADTLAFLLQEEMEDIMNKARLESLQDEALRAYDRLEDTTSAIAFLQVSMQAEIALQLQQQNDHLEFIAARLDGIESYLGVQAKQKEAGK